MKQIISKFTSIMVLLVAVSFSSSAQVIVKIRPVTPVLRARAVAPSPRHIWVTGEYVYAGGRYVYKEGFWAVPSRGRTQWVDGRWKHRRGGWIWIRGHWR